MSFAVDANKTSVKFQRHKPINSNYANPTARVRVLKKTFSQNQRLRIESCRTVRTRRVSAFPIHTTTINKLDIRHHRIEDIDETVAWGALTSST